MGDIIITYETLFEMFRKEKNRGELQELVEDFYVNVVKYLKQKQDILDKSPDSNLFAEEEKVRTEKQVFNIKKLLRDLYERREKKIFEMALSKSRNPKLLIDESALLDEEKIVYQSLITQLKDGRENILIPLLNMKLPSGLALEETERPSEVLSDVELRFVEDTPEFVNMDMVLVGPFKTGQIESFPREIADVLLEKGSAKIVE